MMITWLNNQLNLGHNPKGIQYNASQVSQNYESSWWVERHQNPIRKKMTIIFVLVPSELKNVLLGNCNRTS